MKREILAAPRDFIRILLRRVEMKKRELLTCEIERREIARLSKTYPDITHEAIHGIFHVGFGFGLCEGVGAAKRKRIA